MLDKFACFYGMSNHGSGVSCKARSFPLRGTNIHHTLGFALYIHAMGR